MIQSKKATSFYWAFVLMNIIATLVVVYSVGAIDSQIFDNDAKLATFVDTVQSEYLTKEYVMEKMIDERLESSTPLLLIQFTNFDLDLESNQLERCIINLGSFFRTEYIFYHEGDLNLDGANCYSNPSYQDFEDTFVLEVINPYIKEFLDSNFPRDNHVVDLLDDGTLVIESRRSITTSDGAITYKDIHYNKDIGLDDLHLFLTSLYSEFPSLSSSIDSCLELDPTSSCLDTLDQSLNSYLTREGLSNQFELEVILKKQEGGETFLHQDFIFYEIQVNQINQNREFILNVIFKKEVFEQVTS